MSKQFIIKDWANNTCFKGKTFPSFEEAWGYIYEKDPIPEPVEDNEAHWFDDYYVEEVPALTEEEFQRGLDYLDSFCGASQ